MDTCSVVILVWAGKELFEGFSVFISCGLVFFLLNFFFLLNGLPELFSFNSLKFLKLLGGFSSLFCKPLLEGLFLFLGGGRRELNYLLRCSIPHYFVFTAIFD